MTRYENSADAIASRAHLEVLRKARRKLKKKVRK